MTEIEIQEFRKQFASIVYWQGMIKEQSGTLRRLEAWNKSGSHDNAILNAIEVFKSYKLKLKEKLNGKSYEEWKEFSRNISVLQNKRNRAVNDATKQKWQNQLNALGGFVKPDK